MNIIISPTDQMSESRIRTITPSVIPELAQTVIYNPGRSKYNQITLRIILEGIHMIEHPNPTVYSWLNYASHSFPGGTPLILWYSNTDPLRFGKHYLMMNPQYLMIYIYVCPEIMDHDITIPKLGLTLGEFYSLDDRLSAIPGWGDYSKYDYNRACSYLRNENPEILSTYCRNPEPRDIGMYIRYIGTHINHYGMYTARDVMDSIYHLEESLEHLTTDSARYWLLDITVNGIMRNIADIYITSAIGIHPMHVHRSIRDQNVPLPPDEIEYHQSEMNICTLAAIKLTELTHQDQYVTDMVRELGPPGIMVLMSDVKINYMAGLPMEQSISTARRCNIVRSIVGNPEAHCNLMTERNKMKYKTHMNISNCGSRSSFFGRPMHDLIFDHDHEGKPICYLRDRIYYDLRTPITKVRSGIEVTKHRHKLSLSTVLIDIIYGYMRKLPRMEINM